MEGSESKPKWLEGHEAGRVLSDGVGHVDMGLIVKNQAKDSEFYLKCKGEP